MTDRKFDCRRLAAALALVMAGSLEAEGQSTALAQTAAWYRAAGLL